MTIVWPSSATDRRRKPSTSAPLRESRLPVGSSAKMTSRPGDQRPGAGHPLLLAAGQLGRPVLEPVAQVDRGDHRVEPGLVRLAAGDRQRQRDVLLGGQRRQQVELLEDEADLVPAQLRSAACRDPGSRSPPMNTSPEVGRSSPARQCINVDLPDPDGPMIAVNSPAGKVAVTPSRAVTSVCPVPYTLRSSTAWAAGAPARCRAGAGSGCSRLVSPLGAAPAGPGAWSLSRRDARWAGRVRALGFPPHFLRGRPDLGWPVSAAQPVSAGLRTLRTAGGRPHRGRGWTCASTSRWMRPPPPYGIQRGSELLGPARARARRLGYGGGCRRAAGTAPGSRTSRRAGWVGPEVTAW